MDRHTKLLDSIVVVVDHRDEALKHVEERVDILCKINGLDNKDELKDSEREILRG